MQQPQIPTLVAHLIAVPNRMKTMRERLTNMKAHRSERQIPSNHTLLIEKILRTCPDLSRIYILVRDKKGKDAKNRLKDMLNDVVFQRLKKESPLAQQKLEVVYGDVGKPDLGLSESDRKIIQDNATVILHVAATVNFHEPLKNSVAINVKGTLEMLKLAKNCEKLKSVVHVSTAFSFCPHKEIDEKFYNMPVKYDDLIQLTNTHDDQKLESMLPKILGEWPNTYAFTKAVAEDIVRKNADSLPISIFRPGIVIATYKEPIRSWIDNVYGPTGVAMGAGTGVLHVFRCTSSEIIEMVPGDLVINGIIACAYNTSTMNHTQRHPEDIKIYNYVSSIENPITHEEFMEKNDRYGKQYPTIRALWYHCLILTNNVPFYYLCTLFLHFIPALIFDGFALLTNNKPQLLRLYKKIHKFSGAIAYFACNSWVFHNNNTQALWKGLSHSAQVVYPFSMADMSWEKHSETHLLGLRTYLLKEDLDTLPKAIVKYRRLKLLHNTVKLLFWLFMIYCVYCVFTNILLFIF
ncbi:fatty acyl-CoA reductase wat-like [Ctenocephalides felis]|uniref:fatty acyl-CoA reductase wat-like n=1 Tax=Ctenocephalides felis TaxID=7515 RepID=UPI000E6E50EE|nr:fatty acyl-CoA reductase wat-like [Ctenocephalides felis]